MKNALTAEQLLEFSSAKPVPLILQSEMADCGLASMAMITSYYGQQLNMSAMRKRFSANLKGTNQQQLLDLAASLGLTSRCVQCQPQDLPRLTLPCILQWEMNHFVVLTQASNKGFTINDPATGKKNLTLSEFKQSFTGTALELTPGDGFAEKSKHQPMKFWQLWGNISNFKIPLLKILSLSLIVQVFALASPYSLQYLVDEALISHDQPLLSTLAIGFTLLCIFNVIAITARRYLVLKLSSWLNMKMAISLLHHLLRLPMHYFESRHVGDIASEFGSLSIIHKGFTTGLIKASIDGLMAITVLVIMACYSIKLTLIVVVVITLYAIARYRLYRSQHRAYQASITSTAKEQNHVLENIRAIQAIKLFGNEVQRQGIWQNRCADVINAEFRLGKLQANFNALNKLCFGLENVLIIYLAATLVMADTLTLGMALAFIAYKSQLNLSITNFIEQVSQFTLMRLHLERLVDITKQKQELNRDNDGTQLNDYGLTQKGELVLENVSFRYNEDEANIINNLSVTIKAGDSIAITGHSGSGKTTLVKLMLGLLQPTSGRILFDGQDITRLGLKNYRRQVGAVMQQDTLLAGSISDNICFFNPEPNTLRIEQCARLAAIHKDICQIPMGYNALLGDTGAGLSGGQVQRLLLARALYKRPDILFMDEATSQLDIKNETKISKQISKLNMTRIIISHRRETINQARQVLELDQGQLVTTRSTITRQYN